MIGLIGGSGLETFIEEGDKIDVETPYGSVSAVKGEISDTEILFVSRHGPRHEFPPHKVNYRGNIFSMRKMGVRKILATSAVGALHKTWRLGSIIFPDQQIDYTRTRHYTFHDNQTVHVDLTHPYCPIMSRILTETGRRLATPVREGGTYICFEGPRFETAAEIRMAKILRADVVGMTGCPETALARELGLCYATICIITNRAAGIQEKVTHEETLEVLEREKRTIGPLLEASASELDTFRRTKECLSFEEIGEEFVRRMKA
ncbi:MAG: MTAP family purine nucleoside phosphorylase [Candidatus Geothermarchaeales archaeon]